MLAKLLSGLLSILLSTALAVVLWILGIAEPKDAIIAGLLLEIIIVSHRALLGILGLYPLLGQIGSLPQIPKIIENVDELAKAGGRFNKMILDWLVESFSADVERLRKAKLSLAPDEFMEIAEQIYHSLGAGDSLLATSLFAGGDYWTERFGPDYARFNRQACLRGARIERVFILRNQTHFDQVHAILKQQSEYSNVYVALLDKNPLLEREYRDAFVINDEIAADFHFSQNILTSIDLITDPIEIGEITSLLRRIRDNRASRFTV